MAITPFEEKDYLANAKENYTEVFKNKPVFDKFVQLLLYGANDVQEVVKDLMQLRSIETAKGKQLDIIGTIVGQPRILVDATLLEFFGFQGAAGAREFGSLSSPNVGGMFRNANMATTGYIVANDELYRLLIKAKIAKNTSHTTCEDVIQAVKFILNLEQATITEQQIGEGSTQITIYLSRPLTQLERSLIIGNTDEGYRQTLIPKPAGVTLLFVEYLEGNYFGFQGSPGAQGFGSEMLGSTLGWDDEWDSPWDGVTGVDGGYFATIITA